MGELIITEGISGVWHYHLSDPLHFTKSLCGKQTMKTSMPLSLWGKKSPHIPETYCVRCAERAKANGIKLP